MQGRQPYSKTPNHRASKKIVFIELLVVAWAGEARYAESKSGLHFSLRALVHHLWTVFYLNFILSVDLSALNNAGIKKINNSLLTLPILLKPILRFPKITRPGSDLRFSLSI